MLNLSDGRHRVSLCTRGLRADGRNRINANFMPARPP